MPFPPAPRGQQSTTPLPCCPVPAAQGAADAAVASEEIYWLVLQFLGAGPCAAAAQALEREALALGLLPRRHDAQGAPPGPTCRAARHLACLPPPPRPWHGRVRWGRPGRRACRAAPVCVGMLSPPAAAPAGRQHPMTLSALQQHLPALPSNALQQLLQQLLARKRASGVPGAEGLDSLLATGPLAVLPALGAPARPPSQAWLAAARAPASMPQARMLAETGLAAQRHAPPQLVASQLAHAATMRGHKLAVYCVTWDLAGRRIVTGSDDWLVKARARHAASMPPAPQRRAACCLPPPARLPARPGTSAPAARPCAACSWSAGACPPARPHLPGRPPSPSPAAAPGADLVGAQRPPAAHLPRPQGRDRRFRCQRRQCHGEGCSSQQQLPQ